jgi:predicted aconitase
MVVLGSPHYSLSEFRKLAVLLEEALAAGQRVHPEVQLLVTSSRAMSQLARKAGYLAPLVAFGGKVTVDTCILATPMLPAEVKNLMTTSAKYAYYAPGMIGARVTFGTLAGCVRSAIAGRIVREVDTWGA